jgi:DNA polymerase-3 subunit beta
MTATIDEKTVTTGSTEVRTAELSAALDRVIKALPKRPSAPVLSGVRIASDGDGALTIAGFDLEVSIRTRIEGFGGNLPPTLVPGARLRDVLKQVAKRKIEHVTLTRSAGELTVGYGAGSFDLTTLILEDYPQLPEVPAVSITTNYTTLDKMGRVMVAVGRDDTLPVLTAVKLENAAGQVTTAATDRYRLAVSTLATYSEDTWDALIPAGSLKLVLDVLKPAKKTDWLGSAVTIGAIIDKRWGVSMLSFTSGHLTVTTRLVEGDFPKFRALIPTTANVSATFDTGLMLQAVDTVATVAERNTPVRLDTDHARILVEAGSGDEVAAREKVPAEVVGHREGEWTVIAFNPQYLTDGIKAVGGDRQMLSMVTPNKPALLSTSDDASFTYLIMPVRIGG